MSDKKKKGPLFKIIPGSIVKGSGEGYLVCQTEPVHPHAIKLKDHKCSYVYVHRVVMENHLGRLLSEDEKNQVDHKDKDKTNNKLSNLSLVKRGPHQADHVKRGNHFWKSSPYTKKGNPHKNQKKEASTSSIVNVVTIYLRSFFQ